MNLTKVCFLILVGIAFVSARAPKKPFPQNVEFPNCAKLSKSKSEVNDDITDYYEDWLDNLRAAKKTTNGYYIKSQGTGGSSNKATVSEQHGYGMIIFALMAGYDSNAKKYFDGMYYFFKDHKSIENPALMVWEVNADESDPDGIEASSASDGDMDIAYALLLAHNQWGSDGDINYLREARRMIMTGIQESDIRWESKRIMLGDWADTLVWETRPSDWMGSHLRAYSEVTGDDVFEVVADEIYNVYDKFLNNSKNKGAKNTGLISDFVVGKNADHAPANFLQEYPNTDKYSYNACRVPWRLAMDYAHTGKKEAKEICNKIVTWLKQSTNNNPRNIRNGYYLDGKPLARDSRGTPVFTAPFIAACMVDSKHQKYLDDGWEEIARDQGPDVYNASVNFLCMLFISGNWWVPECPKPKIPKPDVLFDDFKDVYGDKPYQSFLGAAYGYSLDKKDVAKGKGRWYFFHDDKGSFVADKNGTKLDTTERDKMFTDDRLHVKLHTGTSSDGESAYAAVGCQVLHGDKKDKIYYDFSSMKSLVVKAKGKGEIRVSFITKDIDDSEGWGYYNKIIYLSDQWTHYVIDTSYLVVDRYNENLVELGWTWFHQNGRTKVKDIEFHIPQAGKDAELIVDSVYFVDMDYKDDFDFKLTLPVSIDSESLVSKSNPFQVTYGRKNQIELRYFTQTSQGATYRILNAQGKTLFTGSNQQKKLGVQHISINGKKLGLSSGSYFVELLVDKKRFVRSMLVTN